MRDWTEMCRVGRSTPWPQSAEMVSERIERVINVTAISSDGRRSMQNGDWFGQLRNPEKNFKDARANKR